MKNRDISSLYRRKMNYFYRNLCRRPKIVNLASLTLCCCCLIYEFVCVCASIERLNLAREVKFTAFLVALSACAFKPTNPLAYVTRSVISAAVTEYSAEWPDLCHTEIRTYGLDFIAFMLGQSSNIWYKHGTRGCVRTWKSWRTYKGEQWGWRPGWKVWPMRTS